MRDPAPVIELQSVSVRRGGEFLLSDVSWQVGPQDRWVVFGPNGSGKTTLLDVASTYLAPTTGVVRVLGTERGKGDLRSVRSRIGYVGPRPARYLRETLNAHEIVVTGKHASFLPTRWHHYEASDFDVASDCLRRLRAEHLADRPFGQLSEGERKRVLIARSLMARPELLLLDEPAAGLDLGARERLVASLAELASGADAVPIVLVTHHVEEIPPGFDRLLMLRRGTVVAAGDLARVLTGDTLSETYETSLSLESVDGRYRAWSVTDR